MVFFTLTSWKNQSGRNADPNNDNNDDDHDDNEDDDDLGRRFEASTR